ncbi:MAG: type II toxin-antitoxin system PemK/MazF family toxin [Alphaproteobacteria bacterium]
MPSFSAWDIVKVPFPYTDRPIRKYRPALVVVGGDLDKSHGLLWLLMITSAENRRWPDDVPISDIGAAGLPIPSVVRCAKIATVDAHSAERLGMLPRDDRTKVQRHLQRRLRHLL